MRSLEEQAIKLKAREGSSLQTPLPGQSIVCDLAGFNYPLPQPEYYESNMITAVVNLLLKAKSESVVCTVQLGVNCAAWSELSIACTRRCTKVVRKGFDPNLRA